MVENSPKKYYHTNHGPEIFSRQLAFTPEEKRWRREAISFLWERSRTPSDFSTDILRERQATYQVTPPLTEKEIKQQEKRNLREQLTEILLTLRVVSEILKVQYDSPDWGNQPRIIDELVYILLTRRSKIDDGIKHLQAIKEKYAVWEDVAFAARGELKAVIVGGGLEDAKVKNIQESLKAIYKKFGRVDETDFANMSDEELNEFLLSLPGVSQKTSDCVLMYARESDIFPVDTHCLRVIDRLGLFKPFGFNWEQDKNHKQAQKVLRKLLIPPHIRSDLHRNLLALGQEICKRKPICQQCEIRKFCNYYRKRQQEIHITTVAPTAIDMFCGAGGFSLGLSRAGFKIVAAIDNNPDAIRTYGLNHPDVPDEAVIEGVIDGDARKVRVKPLRDLLNGQKLDLLVGGPPCQGFSMMGNRVPHKYENGDKNFGSDYKFTKDKRNHLFKAMLRVARVLTPRYVLIENVPGLGSANIKKEKSYAEYIADRLSRIKYQVEVIRLEAVDFYIPQNRHRYFILGVRQGEQMPDLTRLQNTIPDDQRTYLECALYDLPELDVSDGNWIAAHTNDEKGDAKLAQKYLTRFDNLSIRGNTRILFNHVSRFNNDDDIELYSRLRQGETYRQLVERLTEEFGKKPHFTKYSTDNFKDKYYRLEWHGQSKTIVSHLHKDGNSFVHPVQTRSISVREAARIQSFPDDYIFCGSRGAQFIQIGNAVPPVMAYEVGRVLMNAINEQQDEGVDE